jgi:hypothetical protein
MTPLSLPRERLRRNVGGGEVASVLLRYDIVSPLADLQQRGYFLNGVRQRLACGSGPFIPQVGAHSTEQRCVDARQGPVPAQRGQIANDLTYLLKRAMRQLGVDIQPPLFVVVV